MSHPDPGVVDVRTLADHPEEMTAFLARHDQVMVDVRARCRPPTPASTTR